MSDVSYFALRILQWSWREEVIRQNFDSACRNFGQLSGSEELVLHPPVLDDVDDDDSGEDERHGDADDGHDAAHAEDVLPVLLVLEEAALDVPGHGRGVEHTPEADWRPGGVLLTLRHGHTVRVLLVIVPSLARVHCTTPPLPHTRGGVDLYDIRLT